MIYVVKAGDTLYRIAEEYGTSVNELAYVNQLWRQNDLVVGQSLLIPENMDRSGQRDMYVSGYAYPFVQEPVLSESISVLNDLLVFSYGFTFDGDLIPPITDDLWMIEFSWNHGVKPILVLTPFAETGAFNNMLVKTVVENLEVQERLIQNLVFTVQDRGFAGVDVDFEYIFPEDREGYAAFVGKVREAMAGLGFSTSVALVPKTSSDQPGLLYEGMDYALLGQNADFVFLMTYEWGYTYGPPMAVAPLDKVRQVVNYALSEIPAEKIVMGIPNYGYDWKLPFEKGVTQARLIGNVEAVHIAAENGAQILYNETSQSPFFRYEQYGVEHEVWFEDVRSITEKLNLAKEVNLRGVGYWNLMRPFRANWVLVGETF
ncbi:MAG: LysM peptidoglycan-binding domain-containing protein [Hespellia sp.]|jgi:spore germination protein|nr:LysM peptidoglycan-binding domain-containing protein [Hespellia sp.]